MKYIECPDCDGHGEIFRYEKCVCDDGLVKCEDGDLETCTCCNADNEIEHAEQCHRCNGVGNIWHNNKAYVYFVSYVYSNSSKNN